MNKQSIKELLNNPPYGDELTVTGWIRTKRVSKTFCFLELNDGSCLNNLQVIIDQKLPGYQTLLSQLTTSSSIELTGSLVASPGGKQAVELQAQQVKVIAVAEVETYPLQKKRHSFEFLRELTHLRARTNTIGAIMRIRHILSMAIHQFFNEQGFVYIQTPIITSSDCEGAGEQFQVTTFDLAQVPTINGQVDYSQDFFKKHAALTVSGQLEAEAMAMALGKVYTFAPTFRAEHSGTARHLAEFWMVEPEMAFCDNQENMDMAEAFLKRIFNYVLDHGHQELDFFNQWIDNQVIKNLETIVACPFERISYTAAIDLLKRGQTKFAFPVKWGIDLQSEHEKYLTEVVFKKPVMVTDYPKAIKAFYMKMNDDQQTVRALDVLVPRLGEIIGGSQREDDYTLLHQRMVESGIDPNDYQWYLDLRRYGSAPHAGFGLGFERVVQMVTGMQNIRDVIPFPRAYGGPL